MDEFYALEDPLAVVLVTCVLGGLAAFMAGRAIAQTWRPLWHAVAYMALLGAALRFIHFALFEGDILSIESYAADTVYVIAVAALAWRLTRVTQMTQQYYWLYERSGPFTWRQRESNGSAARGSV